MKNVRVMMLLGLVALPAFAQGRVPYFSLSGDLRDAVGNPVNAPTDLVVRLYDSSAASTTNAIHMEPFPMTTVVRGQFNLQIGTSVPLNEALLFNRADGGAELWVGVQVVGEGEMSPRLRVTSVPWALSADWSGLTSVPATFPPSAHQHPGADVTSSVANATNAASVPWTGVTGRPTTVVTSLTAGTGLTGGVITSTGTIALAGTVQNWATQPTCPAGQFLRSVTAAGVPTCAADANAGGTVTAVTASAPLASSGGATPNLTLAATVQNWATQPTCPVGQYLRSVTAAGVATCAADTNSGGTVTAVTASAPLASSGGASPNLTLGTVPVANGGTGSTTQNFVDLTTNQTIGGNKNFTRVGIGVAAPTNELEISATTPGVVINSASNGYGSIYFEESGNILGLVQQIGPTWPITPSRQNTLEVESITGDIALRTATTDRLRLEASGQLNLNLVAPDAGVSLRVSSSTAGANGLARFENTNVNASQGSTGIIVSDGPGRTIELDLAGTASAVGAFAQHLGYAVLNTNGTPGLDLTTTNNASGVIRFFPAGLATERMRIATNGNVGIGTAAPASRLDLGGGCMTGSVCSDARLKTSIAPLRESVIARVMRLQPSTFMWKGRADQKKAIGVIAQQVESVFPEIVTTSADGAEKGIECTGLTAVALKAIQEQQVLIERQQAQLDLLQKKVEALSRPRR